MTELDLLVTLTLQTSIIRIIDKLFIPSVIRIDAGIERSDDSSEEDVEFALAKIKHFFDQVVSGSVAFSCENTHALSMLVVEAGATRSENTLMLCPELPSDEVLGTLFQAKMNALSGGALFIETINIETDTMSDLSFTLTGNHGTLLPQTMAEWMGTPNFFTVPWWFRDDASTLDVVPATDADLAKTPSWAYGLDFLRRSAPKHEHIGSIVRPDFRPVVIPGGKDK